MPGNTRSRKRNKRRPLAASADVRHALAVNESSQHSRVGSRSRRSTDPPTHTKVATSVANPLSGIPSATVSSEMGNPSEVSGLCDTDRNNKSCTKDIINLESSDELDLFKMNDEHLLSIINSEPSVKIVSLLKALNSFTQKGLNSCLISKYFTQDGRNQALISACRRGHKQLVQTLIRVGANIEYPDENGNTPLLICAENGFTDIVRFLVSRHANVRAVNSVGNTALILSIRSAGSTDMTRFLLEQQDVDIHHQNQHGYTALHMATHFMDVDTMRLLLQKSMARNIDTGYFKDEFKYEMDTYFTNMRSGNIKQETIAARAGLSDVYRILKQHVITGTSPLELAIKAGDITSLDMFLDCQFSSSSDKKRYVDNALTHMFTDSRQSNSLKFSSTEKKIIQRLLENGADVNQGHGPTLLSRAVKSGEFQLVELLCTYGAHVTTHSYSWERDPLCIAAKNGRRDLIELLLKYTADINRGRFSDSALDYALRNNRIECAKLLIKHGAKMEVRYALRSAVDHQAADYMHFLFENYKPEIVDHFSKSTDIARGLLISAVEKGNCEIIGQILDAGVGVSDVDSYADTPLKAATRAEVAQFLIQRGADVNQATPDRNGIETPLIHMIQHRKCADTSTVELCQVLIDNGALVNCRSEEGETPLMLAASREVCVGMLQMLLDKGAEINDKDNNGNTPLHHSIMEQFSKNVCCLINSVRDKIRVINVHNNDGLTPLMVCAKKGNLPIMKALIEGGADVNMKDNQENTALHHLLIALPGDCEEMLACLLKAGSDVNCQNNDGLSPLMLAARKSSASLIVSLLDAGADVNIVSKNNHSKTALSVLSDTEYLGNNLILCIETLLDRGARSSYLSHECLHRLIIQNKINVIPKLIRHGLGPADMEANKISWRRVSSNRPSTVSPLCVALLYGQIPLARYFVDILFLTSSDLSMFACNKAMECLLKEKHQDDSLNLLQELSSQPMSLFQLSLVAVSSAVGPSPGRETRVDSLPLPQMMKDRLLFKSVDDKHPSLTRAPAESNTTGIDIINLLRDHVDMLGCFHADSDDDDDDDEDDDDDYDDFFYPSNVSNSDDDVYYGYYD